MPDQQSSPDIMAVLNHYPLQVVRRIVPVRGGLKNDNWIVHTGDERYFLRRRNPSYTPASIDFELDLIDFLVRGGFPTASIIRNTDGTRRVELNGRFWELYACLNGEGFRVEILAQTSGSAEMLARFHQQVAGFHPDAGSAPERQLGANLAPRALEKVIALVENRASPVGKAMGGPMLSFFQRQVDIIAVATQSQAGTEQSVIHGDFEPTNLLFSGRVPIAVVDFGDAGIGYRAYDVARSVLRFASLKPGYETKNDTDTRLDAPRARAFCRAYQQAFPLNESQIQTLPAMVRLAFLVDLSQLLEREENSLRRSARLSNGRRLIGWLDRYGRQIPNLFE